MPQSSSPPEADAPAPGAKRHARRSSGSSGSVRIESVGSYLPERRVTTSEVVASCSKARRLFLERATGILERRYADVTEGSFSLALRAAVDCFAHSARTPAELDVIIFCGITKYDPDVSTLCFEPSMSLRLAEALGATRARTFDLSNACAGMLTAAYVLEKLIQTGRAHCGLIVSGELISHLATNAARVVDSSQHPQIASLTLGDAGAAAILDDSCMPHEGILSSAFLTQADHVELCTGWLFPDGPGGQMDTSARELQEHSIVGSQFVIRKALAQAGLSFAEIQQVIVHQTAVQTIDKGRAATELAQGASGANWLVTVDRFGNTASTSHFVALRRFLGEGLFTPADRLLLVTQASGMVVGAMVVALGDLATRFSHEN